MRGVEGAGWINDVEVVPLLVCVVEDFEDAVAVFPAGGKGD